MAQETLEGLFDDCRIQMIEKYKNMERSEDLVSVNNNELIIPFSIYEIRYCSDARITCAISRLELNWEPR